MNSRLPGRWGGAALAVVFLLAGCAGDSATPLSSGGGSGGPSIETSLASLDGTVGSPYGGGDKGVVFQIRGSAADTQYYWTVSPLTPPPGLTRLPANDTIPSTIPANTFTLKGTPTACGQYPLQFQVHTVPDHQPVIPPTNFTITISGTCTPPELTLAPLTWLKGVNDSQPLAVTGGTPPYTWSVAGLPTGITINTDTGTLSGAPVNPGLYPLIVTVTDSIGRSANTTVDLTVRALTIADFKGTWSGLILSGDLIQFGSPQSLIGQRLSLLVSDQGVVNQGSVNGTILAPITPPLQFAIEDTGLYPGQFNGRISQLSWHLACDLNSVGNLNCVGHHFSGPQYDGTVILSHVNSSDQDTTAPTVSNSGPDDGATGVTSPQVTVTFSEPMSGSASASLSGVTGTVGVVTFASADPTTATILLSGLQSQTSYTLTLNPVPLAKGHFMDLAGNPLATSTLNFTTGDLTTAALTVTKGGTGSGTVTSDLAGIDCGASCAAVFSIGTSVTLTATPTAGSLFAGWSGACANASGTCTVAISTAKTVTATFNLAPTYTLTVGKSGTGTGTVTSAPTNINCGTLCSATFTAGTSVTLTATPATGSAFVGWSGACTNTTATCVVTMTANQAVTATFNSSPTYLLSVTTTGGSGTGTVTSSPAGIDCGATCAASFNDGTSVVLTASPAATSAFAGWSGACTNPTGTCNVTMTAATTVTAIFDLKPTYALTVAKTGNGGTGTVTSAPTGIDCGATCAAPYTEGTSVVLTATPTTGSAFAGWSDPACPDTGTCTVTMTAARAVTATFNLAPTYVLTVTKPGSGTGTVTSAPAGINCGATCTAPYNDGTSVVLTATPTTGSAFAGWSGACTNATGTCTVTMTTAQAVSAIFNPVPTYVLTVTTSGSGTVTSAPTGINCGATCTAPYNDGTSVVLTATPTTGSAFAGWSGACTNATGTCTITMTTAKSVTATFTLIPTYALTVTTSGSGTVTSAPAGINCGTTCTALYPDGTSVVLTATPAAGSTFAGWSDPACPGTATCSVTITTARAVTATFTLAQTYALTITKGGSGTGTVTSTPAGINCGATCVASFNDGTSVILSASPTPNSAFAGWSGGGCTGTASCSVTMDAAQSVSATFSLLNYTLTVTPFGTGSGTVTSTPAGIDCGSLCSATYSSGTSVILTATASSGSYFSGWSGGGCTGSATCVMSMTTDRSVTATFTLSTGTNQPPLANNQTFTFIKRQILTFLYRTQYAITLTGMDPEGGPLTFKIIPVPCPNLDSLGILYVTPCHQDVIQSMNMATGVLYQFVNPATGAIAQATATTSSTVDLATGSITVSPATSPFTIIYTPNICHDIFAQDTLTFVAIDSAGLESLPATVTMNSTTNLCNHG